MTPGEREVRLAAVLEEAERIHGVVTAKTGGQDLDWALFYAWWLARWSDLPEILGAVPGLADLTAELIALDRAYRASARDEPWPTVYAREMLAVR